MQKLILSYIILIPFMNFLELPVTGKKIQMTEMLFVIMAFYFFILILKNKVVFPNTNKKNLIILFLWPVSLLISLVFNPGKLSLFESLGAIYLVVLTIVIYINVLNDELFLDKVLKILVISGIIAGCLGTLGWCLTQAGYDTALAWSSKRDYPYLGKIGRAKGFTTNPNMLASILILSSFITYLVFYTQKFSKKKLLILQLFFLGALLLTLSKFIVPFLAMHIVILSITFSKNKMLRISAITTAIAMSLFYLFATHLLILKPGPKTDKMLIEEAYADIVPVGSVGDKNIYKTNYTINKIACLEAIERNPLTGLGGGQYNSFLGDLKEEKLYPEYFPSYDPHNTFLGIWAENGIVSQLLMLLIFVIVFVNILKIKHKNIKYSCMVYFLYVLLEASVTDIMNFRQYWVLVAILFAYVISQSNKNDSVEQD